MISLARLGEILNEFSGLTIGLIGDLFLDRYFEIHPDMHVMSIETGREAYQVNAVRDSPGAMGTVLNNLATLGVGTLIPVSVIGDDGHAADLCSRFNGAVVDLSQVIRDAARLTPVYLKPLQRDSSGVWNELDRFDIRTCGPLSDATTATLCAQLRDVFRRSDGLIVIDHIGESNWGVVNEAVRAELQSLANADPEKLIFIDSRKHLGAFPAGCLKGNEFEVTAAVEADCKPHVAVESLARQTNRTAWCTLGEKGMLFSIAGESATHVPAFAVNGPIDIVGAGDAATGGIVSSLLAGASEHEAAVIGNLAGANAVSQIGTTGTSSPAQLKDRLRISN